MKKKVIDTGKNLPKATYKDQWELWDKRKSLVEKPILNQSKRDGTVLYGCYAVNKLTGKGFERSTYDFDVYSRMPRKHAVEIERSIDRGVNANFAYVEKTSYPDKGKMKPLYRVKTHLNDNVEADFNTMPKGVRFVKKNGVRYESLDRASKKYNRMIDHPEMGRGLNAHMDISRIRMSRRRQG